MNKLLLRPICHFGNEQAGNIYEQLRHTLPAQHYTISNNIVLSPNFSTSQVQNNSRANKFSSGQTAIQMNNNQNLSQPQIHVNNLNNNNNINNQTNNINHQYSSPNSLSLQNKTIPNSNTNIGSLSTNNDSIINVYSQFNYQQKSQFDQLKQQNSRLFYQKLALQSSVQKLKEDNIKKDNQIHKLKELLEHKNNINNINTMNNNNNNNNNNMNMNNMNNINSSKTQGIPASQQQTMTNIQTIVSSNNIPVTSTNINTSKYTPNSRIQPARQQNAMYQIINTPQHQNINISNINNQIQYMNKNYENKRIY